MDVYLFGMSLLSRIHILKGPFPEPDGYNEVQERWVVPGGEAANAAILLSGFGLKVRLDGPWLGAKTREVLPQSLRGFGVDVSGMHKEDGFEGLEDLVIVGGKTRNVFGTFQHFFSGDRERWTQPDREAIRSAKVVAVDPYFGAASLETARLAAESGKPLVTIDCPPESPLHQAAAFTVISREFLRQHYAASPPQELFERYVAANKGCTIFTAGSDEILFGRHQQPVQRFKPFAVKVKGTLGAGDSFRAGVVYGLHQGWDDFRTVRFAAATAAMVCTRCPVAADPPRLDEVEALAASRP